MSRTANPITHLMFADDVMLVGQATEKEAEAFLRCLHTYCEWSSQAVNFNKLTVFFSKRGSNEPGKHNSGQVGDAEDEERLYLFRNSVVSVIKKIRER